MTTTDVMSPPNEFMGLFRSVDVTGQGTRTALTLVEIVERSDKREAYRLRRDTVAGYLLERLGLVRENPMFHYELTPEGERVYREIVKPWYEALPKE